MPRLEWNSFGTRLYEAGVDRGVLYVDGQPGVPWNGLTSITESPSGGGSTAYYLDGVKYLNVPDAEEFEGTINALTYPDEFLVCDGTAQPRLGLFISQQRRKAFSLSYRTKIGNDESEEHGYKIHIIYNVLASPTNRDNSTLSDRTNPTDFSWKITSRPPSISEYKRTSHVVVDSRYTDASVLALLEGTLYGTDDDPATLPSFDEVVAIFDTVSTLVVIDHGDGTWTATAPGDVIRMLDSTTFEITAPTAVYVDDVTYTLSSE